MQARPGTSRAGRIARAALFVLALVRPDAPRYGRRIERAALLLCAAGLLVGCSELVSTAPSVPYPFSMFGILNPGSDVQAVIVYPIQQETLRPIGPEPLDAEVTSTDLITGEVRVWRDSVVSDGPAGYSHVFWSDFRAEFGRSYRIETARSDGTASHAVVNVPPKVELETDDRASRWLTLHFPGSGFRLLATELTYGVRYVNLRGDPCSTFHPLVRYTFSYTGQEVRREDGWTLTIDLRRYLLIMHSFYEEDSGLGDELWQGHPDEGLALVDLNVDVRVVEEAWTAPGADLDPELLMQPGTMTNVENGLGFVGGGYRLITELRPSTESIEQGGFFDYLEGRTDCDG